MITNTLVLLISVYAPQDFQSKRLLWNRLLAANNRWSGEILVMGDFNEVRYESERFGSVFYSNVTNFFNQFISDFIIDVSLGGYSFTWTDTVAGKMSKLDRFLILDGLVELYPHFCSSRSVFV